MNILPYHNIDIDILAEELNMGKILVMPTETSYGLIGDACSDLVVKKIFAIKNRPDFKPLPIIFDSYSRVVEYCQVPELLRDLAQRYWPGPFSIVVKPIDDRLKANPSNEFEGTVAVRVTSDLILQDLIRIFKRPLIATSANISGESNCYDSKELIKSFDNNLEKPDFVIDKGVLSNTKPSTLVAVESGKIKVLRQGPIELD